MTTSDLQTVYNDEFDYRVFNKMKDIDQDFDCRPDFTGKMPAVLKSLIKHDVTKTVAGWYPHNHFHIGEGEYVVTHPVKENSNPIFTKYAKVAALQTSVVQKENLKDVVPSTFYYSDGKWRPVQYVCSSVPGAVEAYQHFLQRGREFLPDLTETMKAAGLTERMGLALRNDTSLKRKDNSMLFEKTDTKDRQQLFYWQAEKEITQDLFVTYYCVDAPDSDDSIKAFRDIKNGDDARIIKVPCQRAHQVCAGWNCDG